MSDPVLDPVPAVIARSPIEPPDPEVRHGWQVSARRSTADLTLRDETPLAKVLVRAPFDGATRQALGVSFGRTRRTDVEGAGSVLVVGSAPGEWLALGHPDAAPALRAHLTDLVAGTGEFASVVDITHGRALMRLHGRRSAALLAKVCGIDFADAVTPDGAALRSSVARLVTDVVRDDVPPGRDGPAGPSYLLHCERSSGQYLFDALLDAGAEFGIEITGLVLVPA